MVLTLDILVNANPGPLSHRCFAHVVNIANVAIMGHITRIAAIENATAIWEYDPELPGNRVLGGSLDVIASIRTTAIKVSPFFHSLFRHFISLNSFYQVQASGQQIEHFEKLQIQCKITEPLKIPLHSNIRWGSAYFMLDRAYMLRQVSRNCKFKIDTNFNEGNHSFYSNGGFALRSYHYDPSEWSNHEEDSMDGIYTH